MTDGIPQDAFEGIKEQSNKMHSSNTTKFQNFQDSINAYQMEWEGQDKPKDSEGLKITISPTARFAALGSYNLMTASEPRISVKKPNEVVDNLREDKIERFYKSVLKKSGEMEGTEIHLDASLSAVLMGEVHIGIDLTAEVAKRMKEGEASKAQKKQADILAASTPIRLRVFSPLGASYRRGPAGLTAYYRREDVLRGELREDFPTLPRGNEARLETLHEWWDLEYHVVWLTSESEPLVAAKHDLPYIPVIVTIAAGSKLFSKPEWNSQPFLYTFIKSGLHARESLLLTVMFTKVFQYGLTPPVMIEGGTGNDTLRIDTGGALPVGYLPAGTKASYPMANILDPNVYNLYELTRDLGEQSTIYRQAFGAPLEGGNNPFSTIALLSQQGRLPLTGIQRATAQALKEALRIGTELILDQGMTNHEALDGVDLEKDTEIDVVVDVKMPQDAFRNAQIGAQVAAGPNALVSREWWWENAMGITDSDGMRQQILTEQSYAAAFSSDLMMEMKRREAEAMNVGQNVPTGTETPPPPPEGGEIPPEEAAMMNQAQQGPPPQGEPMPNGQMTAPIEQGMGGMGMPEQGLGMEGMA